MGNKADHIPVRGADVAVGHEVSFAVHLSIKRFVGLAFDDISEHFLLLVALALRNISGVRGRHNGAEAVDNVQLAARAQIHMLVCITGEHLAVDDDDQIAELLIQIICGENHPAERDFVGPAVGIHVIPGRIALIRIDPPDRVFELRSGIPFKPQVEKSIHLLRQHDDIG
ncbi:hypothetical protein D3C73_771190 [compost metagenome]